MADNKSLTREELQKTIWGIADDLRGSVDGWDFVKSVAVAVGAGWDTDCNGAAVGSFAGAISGAENIPEYLSAPLNDTLYSSVFGFHLAGIKECAERSMNLYLRAHSDRS